MTTWTSDELNKIGTADRVTLQRWHAAQPGDNLGGASGFIYCAMCTMPCFDSQLAFFDLVDLDL